MRLWLNKSGEVSLREQLTTQVVVGILCGELAPGARLPSTRELARRFAIHPNTISAAYRELEGEGWVEHRHGSGVFVARRRPNAALSPEQSADQLIGKLVAAARKEKLPLELVKSRVQRWLGADAPTHWLLIEADAELGRIVQHEMGQRLKLPIESCRPEECAELDGLSGALAAVLPSKAAAVRALLPAEVELTVLKIHPVAPALGSYLPAPAGVLIGIASHWQEFQRIAQTMLIAAGFAPESLLVCNARKPNWRRGLETATAVVCDSLTAKELPAKTRAIPFTLLDEAALAELRTLEAAPSAM
jgi:DNA-binding transcriptional regulator YhcF (GntR family)